MRNIVASIAEQFNHQFVYLTHPVRVQPIPIDKIICQPFKKTRVDAFNQRFHIDVSFTVSYSAHIPLSCMLYVVEVHIDLLEMSVPPERLRD